MLALLKNRLNHKSLLSTVRSISFAAFAFALGFIASNHFHLAVRNQGVSSRAHSLSSVHVQESVPGMPPPTTYEEGFKLELPESAPDGSAIRISSLFGMNFATARNLCVKPEFDKQFYLFANGKSVGDLSRAQVRRSGFNFGYEFHTEQGPVPSSAKLLSGRTLVISPAFVKHVTHFAESSIPIWHTLLNRELYPVHSSAVRIFLKQMPLEDDLEWNRYILRFLAHEAGITDIVHSKSFSSTSWLCFAEAALVGMGVHEFGYFANEGEGQKFRRNILSFYNVPLLETSLHRKSRCMVLQRTGTRQITNWEAVGAAVEATGLYDCTGWSSALHGKMEKLSMQEQLAALSNTALLVGLHGSGLVNALFLSPHSAIIDLLPHNYMEIEWHNFAAKAGVRFYFMFLGDSACANQCDGSVLDTSKVNCRSVMSCNHAFKDPKTLQVIAVQADFHLRVSPHIRHMHQPERPYSGGKARNDADLDPPLPLPSSLLSGLLQLP